MEHTSPDGGTAEVHRFDLCEACYEELISQFKVAVDVEEQTELL